MGQTAVQGMHVPWKVREWIVFCDVISITILLRSVNSSIYRVRPLVVIFVTSDLVQPPESTVCQLYA